MALEVRTASPAQAQTATIGKQRRVLQTKNGRRSVIVATDALCFALGEPDLYGLVSDATVVLIFALNGEQLDAQARSSTERDPLDCISEAELQAYWRSRPGHHVDVFAPFASSYVGRHRIVVTRLSDSRDKRAVVPMTWAPSPTAR